MDGAAAAPGLMEVVRPERASDLPSIREVNRLAFSQDDEARLVNALRDGGHRRGLFVAEVDDQVVGHILFSELAIVTDGGIIEALALAPLAVIPSHQGLDVGRGRASSV
jgi:putative acetyltransferase